MKEQSMHGLLQKERSSQSRSFKMASLDLDPWMRKSATIIFTNIIQAPKHNSTSLQTDKFPAISIICTMHYN